MCQADQIALPRRNLARVVGLFRHSINAPGDDGPLTEDGMRLCRVVSEDFQKVEATIAGLFEKSYAGVFTSRKIRARDTAQLVYPERTITELEGYLDCWLTLAQTGQWAADRKTLGLSVPAQLAALAAADYERLLSGNRFRMAMIATAGFCTGHDRDLPFTIGFGHGIEAALYPVISNLARPQYAGLAPLQGFFYFWDEEMRPLTVVKFTPEATLVHE